MAIGFPVVARAVLPAVDGVVKDAVMNTFAFVDATSLALAAAAVIGFYNNTQATNARKVREFISGTISRAALIAHVDIYNLDTAGKLLGTAPLGSPVLSVPFTLGADTGTSALPSEVAIACSFAASMGTRIEKGPVDASIPSTEAAIDQGAPAVHSGLDHMRARRRGRVYIGPLNEAAMTLNVTTENRPVAALLTVLSEASKQLRDDAVTDWGVWSRRDGAVVSVVSGFIDNAFDTIRKRGQGPTARTVWS